MTFCMGEFLQGIFNQDCRDFAVANQQAKEAAAKEAAEKQAEAERKAKEAADDEKAAQDAILNAWTEEIDTGLPTPEEEIAALEKRLYQL